MRDGHHLNLIPHTQDSHFTNIIFRSILLPRGFSKLKLCEFDPACCVRQGLFTETLLLKINKAFIESAFLFYSNPFFSLMSTVLGLFKYLIICF